MTDIKPNARALMDEVKREHPTLSDYTLAVFAAQRAIERHEAFKQKVSDVVEIWRDSTESDSLEVIDLAEQDLLGFIIPKPKPDPLEDVLEDIYIAPHHAKIIRAALGALGFEIREKGQ